MQRFRRILVGVDLPEGESPDALELTAPTQEAVRRAVWLAGHTSAEVVFLSVVDTSHIHALLSDDDEAANTVASAASRMLDELVEGAKADEVAATSRVVEGVAWEEITREVVAGGADLVVVGTRGLGRAGRFLFGSTGMKLLRACPCPVWITRPDPDWTDLNILVASDLSDVSQTALDIAVNLGGLAPTKIHLLHSVENPPDRHLWHTGLSEAQIGEQRRKLREDSEQRLNNQLAGTDYRIVQPGVQVHVEDGPADVVIERAVKEYGIDLLVMGTAARSGLSGFMLGNTCERLLSSVDCSILTIKPTGFECPVDFD